MLEKKLKIDVKRVIAITLTYNRTYDHDMTVFETKTYRSPETAARQWSNATSVKFYRRGKNRIKDITEKLYRRSYPIFKKLFDA